MGGPCQWCPELESLPRVVVVTIAGVQLCENCIPTNDYWSCNGGQPWFGGQKATKFSPNNGTYVLVQNPTSPCHYQYYVTGDPFLGINYLYTDRACLYPLLCNNVHQKTGSTNFSLYVHIGFTYIMATGPRGLRTYYYYTFGGSPSHRLDECLNPTGAVTRTNAVPEDCNTLTSDVGWNTNWTNATIDIVGWG